MNELHSGFFFVFSLVEHLAGGPTLSPQQVSIHHSVDMGETVLQVAQETQIELQLPSLLARFFAENISLAFFFLFHKNSKAFQAWHSMTPIYVMLHVLVCRNFLRI